MKVFLSYSRKDWTHLQVLTDGVKHAGHDLWLDEELSGGAEWWQTILERIRTADAFLAIISKASLASIACSREREYALALGKPVLPVLIERVSTQILPPDIAQRQIVDFTTPDAAAAFRLAGGIKALPPARPLSDSLPTPPEIPLSYLSDISQQVYAQSLTRDQQLMIIEKLRSALSDEDSYDSALELARLLEKRDDLYVAAERPLREILSSPRPGRPQRATAIMDTPDRALPLERDVKPHTLRKLALATSFIIAAGVLTYGIVLTTPHFYYDLGGVGIKLTVASGLVIIALVATVIALKRHRAL